MNYAESLSEGRLLRRYQRFLADIELGDGEVITAHVPNTGSMLGCLELGQGARLSRARDTTRRCPYTLEQIQVGKVWVGVNTHRANALVGEALKRGAIEEVSGYASHRPEVSYGQQRSRIDWLLEDQNSPVCYLEVKSVTTSLEPGIGLFPDAISQRALKHLGELRDCVVQEGARSVLLFCVQRADVHVVHPADAIDPAYGRLLREVMREGVEVLAYGVEPTRTGLLWGPRIGVHCP
ncbi:MAG: DNA/RNA nuclease SfsA [Ferrovum myxofaciens]|uniref:DNA/RNA nuclease SfsA n=1 Tax=Ferrovum myxofaciens TaxID=416213 RepID=UPI002354C8DC|nr:DNA/RNA nuclease SfsA [Ferrovum myxofaciens]QKE40260.1 MAG: DNA/RNA nuclease SfsA [Ferrovum myxofaciens]